MNIFFNQKSISIKRTCSINFLCANGHIFLYESNVTIYLRIFLNCIYFMQGMKLLLHALFPLESGSCTYIVEIFFIQHAQVISLFLRFTQKNIWMFWSMLQVNFDKNLCSYLQNGNVNQRKPMSLL